MICKLYNINPNNDIRSWHSFFCEASVIPGYNLLSPCECLSISRMYYAASKAEKRSLNDTASFPSSEVTFGSEESRQTSSGQKDDAVS